MTSVVSEHAAGYEIERRVGWTSFERPSPRSNMYFFHSLVLLSIMGAEVIIDGRGRGGGKKKRGAIRTVTTAAPEERTA